MSIKNIYLFKVIIRDTETNDEVEVSRFNSLFREIFDANSQNSALKLTYENAEPITGGYPQSERGAGGDFQRNGRPSAERGTGQANRLLQNPGAGHALPHCKPLPGQSAGGGSAPLSGGAGRAAAGGASSRGGRLAAFAADCRRRGCDTAFDRFSGRRRHPDAGADG